MVAFNRRNPRPETLMKLRVMAVTFDDFNTMRYSAGEGEDIIHQISRELKRRGLEFDDQEFLRHYFMVDEEYRKTLRETLRESLLDEIVFSALVQCGCEPENVREAVTEAVDGGIASRETKWFQDANRTLRTLRERGYRLGVISNTHWRMPDGLRDEFDGLFDVVTLSYEHGYVKPHPSIFLETLSMLGVDPKDCLHVGDDPISDIRGAKVVGMVTAFVKRRRLEADADLSIKRLDELVAYLLRPGKGSRNIGTYSLGGVLFV